MGNLKNLGKALILSGGLIFSGQGLEASSGTTGKSQLEELNNQKKTELIDNLEAVEKGVNNVHETEYLRSDSANTIPFEFINRQLRNLVRQRIPGINYRRYGHKKYIKEAKKIQKEYKKKVKELKLNETVFKCGEEEFDRKMNEIEQEILRNPDKYGYFNSEGKFVINVDSYNNLIHEKFPELGNDDLFDSYLDYDDRRQYILLDAAQEGTEWTGGEEGWLLLGLLSFITALLGGISLNTYYVKHYNRRNH